MKRKHSRRIRDLLERADHGETTELRLRYRDDPPLDEGEREDAVGETSVDEPGFLAYAEELRDDWRHGRSWSKEQCDFLMYVLLDYELGPPKGGRLANKQAKAAKVQALIGPACEYRRLRKEGRTAIEAAQIVARRYPQLFAEKKPETVLDILRHA